MKIAVLISGHMRNYSSCLENQYTHLFNLNAGKEKNNLDIFIYTSYTDSLKHKKGNPKINSIRGLQVFEQNSDFEHKLRSSYSSYLKEIYIENEKIGEEKQYSYEDVEHWHWHRNNQFRKLYECFKMMKNYSQNNNIKYDAIIRCRPDIVFQTKPIVVRKHIKSDNEIFCFGGWDVPKTVMSHKLAFFDGFSFGSYNSMKRYCSAFLRENPEQGPFTPENQVVLHLKEGNIDIKYLNKSRQKRLGKEYEIKR